MNLEMIVMFSLLLFSIGLYGVLTRRNLIAVLIGAELAAAEALQDLGVTQPYSPA